MSSKLPVNYQKEYVKNCQRPNIKKRRITEALKGVFALTVFMLLQLFISHRIVAGRYEVTVDRLDMLSNLPSNLLFHDMRDEANRKAVHQKRKVNPVELNHRQLYEEQAKPKERQQERLVEEERHQEQRKQQQEDTKQQTNLQQESRREVSKQQIALQQRHQHQKAPSGGMNPASVSVVIVTYKKEGALAKLLPSIISQETKTNFEIIIVDTGCLNKTKQIISSEFGTISVKKGGKTMPTPSYKYLPLCDNPGYAAANNAGVKLASDASRWLLFLNDDVVLSESSFLQSMLHLGTSRHDAAAVGCKLVTGTGDELIEAGSIVWNDGSAAGYGRGRTDVNADEFTYPRPVDYISGACLLADKKVFTDYGGFDVKNFPNYYEDTDFQMHIQHTLGKEVWYQPLAVAMHDEHGSFGTDESLRWMKTASKVFFAKWKIFLSQKHLPNPHSLPEKEKKKTLFRANDLRARNSHRANILFVDNMAPNKLTGQGFGRTFDNLSMITDLGHKVTLITLRPPNELGHCKKACVQEIESLGLEYATGKWNDIAQSRIGYYDIVIISRPGTFQHTAQVWKKIYKQSPFSLVYDCEALAFRRDDRLMDLVLNEKIPFPSVVSSPTETLKPETQALLLKARIANRENELAMLSMADVVIPVSEGEKEFIQNTTKLRNLYTVGHIMDLDRMTSRAFAERNGILYLASFNKLMYYNGDAIWYFLQEIYPLVIQESSIPIPLTIAGRGIPRKLRQVVKENSVISQHVTFLESPATIDHLYIQNRVFIAPHLYGAGIQYKVSEAFSYGVPVAMSSFTAKSFGFNAESDESSPGCTGSSIDSYKKCVLDLHNNEEKWTNSRNGGFEFLQQTHNRQNIMQQWTEVIDSSSKVIKEIRNGGAVKEDHGLLTSTVPKDASGDVKGICPEGEELYFFMYKDVKTAVKSGHKKIRSGFQHWQLAGKAEGRTYLCFE